MITEAKTRAVDLGYAILRSNSAINEEWREFSRTSAGIDQSRWSALSNGGGFPRTERENENSRTLPVFGTFVVNTAVPRCENFGKPRAPLLAHDELLRLTNPKDDEA
jgi:hypothetical protein